MTLHVDIQYAVGHLSLSAQIQIEQPGITALFGPSGSGKTTVMNAIAGLIRPSQGYIRLQERDLFNHHQHLHLPTHQRRIGYVFQEARLFPHLSVKKNLYYGHRRSLAPLAQAQCQQVIELLGLEYLMERPPRHLSGGEKQRVALGRALLSNPDILLLDEPLSALDPSRKHDILPYLERIRDEHQIPMLYVSHALEEVTRLANHIVLIADGQTHAQGTVEALQDHPALAPLKHQLDIGTLLSGTVQHYDSATDLTCVETKGLQWRINGYYGPTGQAVRLEVPLQYATLSTEPLGSTSTLNHLSGHIRQLNSCSITLQVSEDLPPINVPLPHYQQTLMGLTKAQRIFVSIPAVKVLSRMSRI